MIYEITVSRLGTAQIEAPNLETAERLADSLKTSDIRWDDDWSVINAELDEGSLPPVITSKQIENGLKKNVIRLIKDPDANTGTVCSIGDYWFNFDVERAESLNPEEYRKAVPFRRIIDKIRQTLSAFREDDAFIDEYSYYQSILKDHNC